MPKLTSKKNFIKIYSIEDMLELEGDINAELPCKRGKLYLSNGYIITFNKHVTSYYAIISYKTLSCRRLENKQESVILYDYAYPIEWGIFISDEDNETRVIK